MNLHPSRIAVFVNSKSAVETLIADDDPGGSGNKYSAPDAGVKGKSVIHSVKVNL